MDCPITNAIKTIRGGYFASRTENDDTRVVIVGSGETYVCDDVSFYMSKRRMTFARYEVSMKNNTQCAQPHTFAGKTYHDVARAIIGEIKHYLLYDQIVAVCDLISRIEDLIQRKLYTINKPNITLCNLCRDVLDIDPRSLFNASAAYDVVNMLHQHVSGTDINVLLSSPCITKLDPVPEFPSSIDMHTIISAESHLDQEMKVAEYLHAVEGYHCELIKSLNQIHSLCDEITAKI